MKKALRGDLKWKLTRAKSKHVPHRSERARKKNSARNMNEGRETHTHTGTALDRRTNHGNLTQCLLCLMTIQDNKFIFMARFMYTFSGKLTNLQYADFRIRFFFSRTKMEKTTTTF